MIFTLMVSIRPPRPPPRRRPSCTAACAAGKPSLGFPPLAAEELGHSEPKAALGMEQQSREPRPRCLPGTPWPRQCARGIHARCPVSASARPAAATSSRAPWRRDADFDVAGLAACPRSPYS
ncbi:uncharacterized protein LOC111529402 [Piliocolobus tephrosceles]|uniref:uncharacterized protein LOC111529402 n=1 Tax=Piliocolobus tephrosceles TaxID=591936 RepID=UPI000C29DEC2|nr:uncharacterized protein LOC111529402 [Piliocolobus tephrosceles]